MRIRRSNRIWYILFGVFVGVALFSFLIHGKTIREAEAASLAGFDPGYIISDWQMGNYNSMSENDIQRFLTSKNPCATTSYSGLYGATWHYENGHFICLSEERFGNNDGEIGFQYGESAAHIIWQAAQDYRINPQVLLVLLQKETSLITDPIPNNYDYRKATGFGCPDTAACSSKYYGFKNQIRNAAALFRTVLDGGWTNYPLGNNYIQYNPNAACGGSVVNVRSLATSALYRYTPYQPNAATLAAGYGTASCGAYGNRNFYLYFEDWFGSLTDIEQVAAPTGLSVAEDNGKITVSWNKPHNSDLFAWLEYEVVLAYGSGIETRVTVGSEQTSYTFDSLPEGVYYAASVKAITGVTSNFTRTTFDMIIGNTPDAPTGIVVKMRNHRLVVSWDGARGSKLPIDKYEVVVAREGGFENKATVGGEQTMYVFEDLLQDVYYAASVKAFNIKGSNWGRVTFSLDISQDSGFPISEERIKGVGSYTGFADMPSDEISKKAVSWAATNGITDKNTYFNGDNALTRRQAMVLLYRLVGEPETEIYTGFADMPSDEISKKAVSWAVMNHITDRNNYFNGDNALTRRQAMVLLYRLVGEPDTEIYTSFVDMPSDGASKKAVSWVLYNGITDKNTYFNGDNALTRRQAMVLLYRLCN